MVLLDAFLSSSNWIVKIIAVGLCLTGLSSPVTAQDETLALEEVDDRPPETIIVTGSQDSETARKARDLARSLLGKHRSYEVGARFNVPVCLAINGIDEAFVEVMKERFYENVRSFGLKTGDQGCQKKRPCCLCR